jgi:acyl-CoA synthetase (AMP-forming)/AMP-acid ligase II
LACGRCTILYFVPAVDHLVMRAVHQLVAIDTTGVINCVAVPLAVGATIEFLTRGFDPDLVWKRLIGKSPSSSTSSAPSSPPISLLMAVPTIYHQLLATHTAAGPAQRATMSAAARSLRLAVCGSAALPPPVFAAWEDLAGQALLERLVARAQLPWQLHHVQPQPTYRPVLCQPQPTFRPVSAPTHVPSSISPNSRTVLCQPRSSSGKLYAPGSRLHV